jgi:GTPase SAR1 family protein
VLVGDGEVGKTSLLQRLVDNGFASNYTPTIGVDMVREFSAFLKDAE